MDDMIAFLKARLDEDEALAKGAARFGIAGIAGRAHWVNRFGMVVDAEDEDWAVTDLGAYGADDEVHAHIARHDPARVLREVEAKRAILAEVTEAVAVSPQPWLLGDRVLRRLAAVYSGHPGYRQEWAI